MARNRSQNSSFVIASQVRGSSGQTMIEYILLFAVSMSFIYLIFQSDTFKSTFGDEGLFSKTFAQKIACNYRYGDSIASGRGCNLDNRDYQDKVHQLYFPTSNDTRFFGPRTPYPGQ